MIRYKRILNRRYLLLGGAQFGSNYNIMIRTLATIRGSKRFFSIQLALSGGFGPKPICERNPLRTFPDENVCPTKKVGQKSDSACFVHGG